MNDEFADFAADTDLDFGDVETSAHAAPPLLPLAGERGQRARDLIAFSDALDDVGMADAARRCRVTANDVLEALDELEAARLSIASLREDRDRWRDERWREAHGEGWPK